MGRYTYILYHIPPKVGGCDLVYALPPCTVLWNFLPLTLLLGSHEPTDHRCHQLYALAYTHRSETQRFHHFRGNDADASLTSVRIRETLGSSNEKKQHDRSNPHTPNYDRNACRNYLLRDSGIVTRRQAQRALRSLPTYADCVGYRPTRRRLR